MPRKPHTPWWRTLLHLELRCTWPWCWRAWTRDDGRCDRHHAQRLDPWERM